MQNSEVIAVQNYLRKLFGGDRIRLKAGRPGHPVEVYVGDEFVGTVYRDDEDGEVTYTLTLTVLASDLDQRGGD
ncbi:MAG: DUF3126 family protein [Alphaproteobacteria bacterium]|nr:MAG: DUF3126 family protein [Alphaproteobacteria bacterium]